MSEITKIETNLTARQLAAKELKEEVRKEAVAAMKIKLKEIHKARIVLANLEREAEELEREIENGIS